MKRIPRAYVGRAVVAAVGLLCAAPSGAQSPATTAFVNVSVIPMDREQVLSGQTVVVRGDRIVAMGPAAQVQVPAGATRIDGTGKFLLPGLADMHVHLAFGTPADTARIQGELLALVANGVTTVRDMHSGGRGPRNGDDLPGAWRQALRRRIATGELLGPRLYTAGDPDLSSPEAVARTVAELKEDGNDFVKIDFGDQRWPTQKAVYDSLIAAAHRVGLRVVGHAPEGLPLQQLFADRWASTEHLYEYVETVLGLAGRWSFTDGGILSNLKQAYADTAFWMKPGYRLDSVKLHELAVATKQAGVWNCPTLYMMHFMNDGLTKGGQGGFGGDMSVGVLGRWNAFDRQVTKSLQDAGARLLAGTDAGGNWRGEALGFTLQGELQTLVKAGLTPYQALVAATRNPAEFLGTLDSSGTVAVGKRADLVLLSGNPLQDIGYTAGPAGVMLGGQWLSRADLNTRLDALKSPTPESAWFYKLVARGRRTVWHH